MKYYIAYIGSFMAAFISLPIYNYYIDWYGFFQTPKNGTIRTLRDITNTNGQLNSPNIRTKNAIEKLQSEDNITLIMGSSRIHRGIIASKFSNKTGYKIVKLSYPVALLDEHLKTLTAITNKGLKPKRVIIGIDDYALMKFPNKIGRKLNRRLYPLNFIEKLSLYWDCIFRVTSAKEIIEVINSNWKVIEAISGHPFTSAPNDKNHEIKMYSSSNVPIEKRLKYSVEEHLKTIDKIIRISENNDFDLVLFFTPRWVSTAYAHNQREIFSFKKALARKLPFYDFSGITIETSSAKYWMEVSHFTAELGDIIADKLGAKRSDDLFGRLVTHANIEEHLKELKQNFIDNYDGWIDKKPDGEIHPELYSWIFKSYNETELSVHHNLSLSENDWFKPQEKDKYLWSKKKEVSIVTPGLRNINQIKFHLIGAHDSFYNEKRKTRKITIKINDQYYGDIYFGQDWPYSNKKEIAILGDFEKGAKISFVVSNLYQPSSSKKSMDNQKLGFMLKDEFIAVTFER
jgi:hypothetical protein